MPDKPVRDQRDNKRHSHDAKGRHPEWRGEGLAQRREPRAVGLSRAEDLRRRRKSCQRLIRDGRLGQLGQLDQLSEVAPAWWAVGQVALEIELDSRGQRLFEIGRRQVDIETVALDHLTLTQKSPDYGAEFVSGVVCFARHGLLNQVKKCF